MSTESLIGRKCKGLTLESNVKTLAIKIYDEQLPNGWDNTKELIQNLNPSKYQAIAIKHDKDYSKDDFFKPSSEKAHYHIIVRVMDGVNITKNGLHVRQILKDLGIVFREEDKIMAENHGLETVGNFSHYATYLTHETEKAIADGKQIYNTSELVSNLTQDEIQQIRDGYTRLSSSEKKVSIDDMIELDKQAKEKGYNLEDFDDWYDSLPLVIRANCKMKQVKETYMRGVAKRVSEDDSVTRLCIFIKGGANLGKTYNTIRALKAMGLTHILTIGGGGSGKFDNLKPSTQAMIIDDDTIPNLLNMTDNKMCQAYKRQANNPWWCGALVIVTSNLDFDEWIEKCGIKTKKYKHNQYYISDHLQAMQSRFYQCHIGEVSGINRLICDSPSTRGNSEQQLNRKKMYIQFRDEFNESIEKYLPREEEISYDDLNDYDKESPFGPIDYSMIDDDDENPFE